MALLDTSDASPPHAGEILLTAGAPLEDARLAVILLHGRGASARDILGLADVLDIEDAFFVAPQAADSQWYPLPFRSPRSQNQAGIDSAFSVIASLINALTARGLDPTRIALGGFSQGACLATDFVAHHPRRYGAVFAFTGGLIGEPGTRFTFPGSLEGTPVFLGTNDPDPHVPFARVKETAGILRGMGAEVELVRYPGVPHTVVADEIERARRLLEGIGRNGRD